jgi:hypothetical protein
MAPKDQNDPPESEMLDIVVMLDVTSPTEMATAVEGLKQAGLQVVNVNNDEGVVEGTIPAEKYAALRKAPKVKYVRDRFRYMTREEDQ